MRQGLTKFLSASVATVAMGLLAVVVPTTSAHADEVRDRQYWLSQYGILDAWSISRGAGVTIAIIDTGVDFEHQDLQGAIAGGTDVSGLGSNGEVIANLRGNQHGTMVASLAVGRGHGDESGVVGSAPEARLLSISMSFEDAPIPADDQIAEAVIWAVDNGADVISLSLTRNTSEWPVSWDEAFGYAEDNDVVVVAAAGNRGSGTEAVGAPATMPGVLTVGGVNRGGLASDNASSQGITIGVMAPSEDLVGAYPGNQYAVWEGTSGSTPIVAGIVALVRAAHPDLDAANVIHRILATATPVGASIPDPLYGYGLINAYQAVAAEVPRVTENPLGSIAEWVVLYRRGDGEALVYPLGPVAEASSTPAPELGQAPSSTLSPMQLSAAVGWSAALVFSVVAVFALTAVSALRVRGKQID
jgi:subtilisin family serine protease